MQTCVSIIIPVYNAEPYLDSCLSSVFGQTLQSIEVICINDGSTDRSAAILKEWQQKEPRLKILNGTHGGPSQARNMGLSQAIGDYISFVDSDDMIDPGMMNAMYQAAHQNNADMVICGLALEFESPSAYDQGAVNWGKAQHEGTETACGEIAGRLRTNVLDKLFRRELITSHQIRFVEGLRFNEDGVFVWSFLPYCRLITFIGQNYYHYLQRSHSAIARIYARQDATVLQLIPSWEKMEATLIQAGKQNEYLPPLLDLISAHIKHFGQYIPPEHQTEWQNGVTAYLHHIADTYPALVCQYRSSHKKQAKILFSSTGSILKRIYRSIFN